MNETNEATVENLSSLLKPWQIDWEPKIRERAWTPRRTRRTGL
jgi:hypothetical protein